MSEEALTMRYETRRELLPHLNMWENLYDDGNLCVFNINLPQANEDLSQTWS